MEEHAAASWYFHNYKGYSVNTATNLVYKKKKSKSLHCNNLLLFGQARLELATPSPPDLYANHLRYCPICLSGLK